jgi:hypothetical protein
MVKSMKKTSRQQFLYSASSTLLALSLPEIGFAADIRPAEIDIAWKKLKPEHPRLLITENDITKTREYLKNDTLAKQYLDLVMAAGEKMLTQPPVKHELIGPRLLDKSRTCLSRVYTLATLYRLDNNPKWLDRAKLELMTVCAFPDWNPSHFLDVAEMTHAVAIGYDWLYPALTPDERKTIKTAIAEKGLRRGEEAYKGTEQWKWWTTVHHNWNQVCNGGMILGSLAVADEEPELSRFILTSALKSLPLALASFAPDGGWNEGPGYWDYTLQYTVALLAGLNSALGTDFNLSREAGFDRTGTFRVYFVGPTGRTFNYADAGEGKAGDAPVMFWLSRHFQQPLYTWEATRSAGSGGSALDLLWYQPSNQTPVSAKVPLDNFFRGVDVAFLRSAWDDPNALWVGFKGGDNKANHSHLDLGSFVFDALGERWVSEIGSDNYNLPGYFGKQRWTYYRLKTEGQNTVVLNGENQDPKAVAPLKAFSSKPETAYAVADLTAGYAPVSASKVLRGMALVNNRKALLVQDEVSTASPTDYRWQIHTRAEIAISGSEATLTLNGKTLSARILSPAGATFAVESAAPPPINGGEGPQQNPNTGFRKLAVHLPEKIKDVRVAVLLAPAGVASQTPTITSLEDWIKSAPPLPKLGGNL